MRRGAWVAISCALLATSAAAGNDVGVIVLAHGGTGRWNHAVEETVLHARLASPVEVAFGMGMHASEVLDIQQAVDKLQRRGVSRIIVVPLLVSSSSEVMRQYQYLFGVREHGPWEEHIKPLTLRVPVTLTPALDDDPIVGEILLERALAVSRVPAEESVVLVAHGPVSDEDNLRWLDMMERIAKRVQKMGNFRAVVPATMRDDAPKPVRDAAVQQMRSLVRAQGVHGRALVIPMLIANGGIEDKIAQALRGLTYVYQEQALLPDPKVAQWMAARVLEALGPGTVGVDADRQPERGSVSGTVVLK